MKFLAKANHRGYKTILLGKVTVPKDSDTINSSSAAGKEQLKIRKLNKVAYKELLLSIDGNKSTAKTAFSLVKLSKTSDLAEGDAALAWTRLQEKYATKLAPTLLALKKQFTDSKLGKKDDPEEWITELETI